MSKNKLKLFKISSNIKGLVHHDLIFMHTVYIIAHDKHKALKKFTDTYHTVGKITVEKIKLKNGVMIP